MDRSDSDKNDSALAVLVQKGDRESFSGLVDRYQGRIFNFCYHFSRSRDTAGDLTQETFLRAYRFIRKYDPKRKFSTWIYSIARNICIDEKRKTDRVKTVPLDEISTDALPSAGTNRHLKNPSEISLHLEDQAILGEAIGHLPEKYRTVVILCYFEELPYREIAEIMGMSLNLVKIRIFRAKKMLVEILRERGWPDAT